MKALLDTLARPGRPRLPSLLQALQKARALRRQRLRLGELDDRMLRDVGLTRAQAEDEARRLAWDAPGHWFER